MEGVEMPQAPRGVGREEGIYCRKGMRRGLYPSLEFVENTIF